MKAEQISALIAPTVEALGCELWGVQLIQAKHSTLRIYIEAEGGAGIEECEKVSRDVSRLLDVEDPISGEYTLEVSTPGLDRLLFSLAQCERYVGEEASVRLRVPLDGQRNFKGRLAGVDGDALRLALDDRELRLPWANIERTQLVPDFGPAPGAQKSRRNT